MHLKRTDMENMELKQIKKANRNSALKCSFQQKTFNYNFYK